MATARLVPPQVKQNVELTLTPEEAQILRSVLGYVSGGNGYIINMKKALDSVGCSFTCNVFRTKGNVNVPRDYHPWGE